MDFNLMFFEKNKYYEQKVKVGQLFVEYDVPEHAGVEQSEYLNDYDAVRYFFFYYKQIEKYSTFL